MIVFQNFIFIALMVPENDISERVQSGPDLITNGQPNGRRSKLSAVF